MSAGRNFIDLVGIRKSPLGKGKLDEQLFDDLISS